LAMSRPPKLGSSSTTNRLIGSMGGCLRERGFAS
jgi:hypothetical protein